MAKSRSATEAGTASHDGALRKLNRPHPRASTSNAMPTAAGKDEPDSESVENDDAQIARPTLQTPDDLTAPWRQQFPEGHCRKHGTERRQPDPRFGYRQQLSQGFSFDAMDLTDGICSTIIQLIY